MERDLTAPEAAKLLKVSTQTIHRWVGTGKLKGYSIGTKSHRHLRIQREAIEELAKRLKNRQGSEHVVEKPTARSAHHKPIP